MTASALPSDLHLAFIGGGNMASAIIGGLRRQGVAAERIDVVEPFEASRDALRAAHGIEAHAAAGDFLARAGLIVWPSSRKAFATPPRPWPRTRPRRCTCR